MKTLKNIIATTLSVIAVLIMFPFMLVWWFITGLLLILFGADTTRDWSFIDYGRHE